MDLSVVIVNYNVKEYLLNLIDSLKKSAKNLNYEIIVIDNKSDDGSVEVLNSNYPEVKLIANDLNVGFGKANNQGLEIAQGEFILLINPDTIVKEDTISKLIEYFNKNSDCGMAGCKVLNPDGTLQLACRRSFPGPWTSFTKVSGLSRLFPKSKLFSRYNLTYLDENQTYEVDAISGSFMIWRKTVYEKIGGFDPDFFMYGEDLDLCFRVQQSGYKVHYFHETEIIHYKGESTKRSNLDETKIFYEAMHLFVKKHLSSSFFVGLILNFAIKSRKLLAFLNRNKILIFGALLDLILFIGSLVVAEEIYKTGKWKGFPEIYKPWVYIIPGVLQSLILIISGSYKRKTISIFRSFLGLFIGALVLTSASFFFKQFAFSRAVILITYTISGFLFLIWKSILKLVFKTGLNYKISKRNTLIVGTDNNASEISKKLQANLNNLYSVIGFIAETNQELNTKVNGTQVIGTYSNIKKVVDERKIDLIIFAAGNLSFDTIFNIVANFKGEDIEFQVVGSSKDFIVGKSHVTLLDDIPLMEISLNINNSSNRVLKFILDKFLSFFGLLLLYIPIYPILKIFKIESDFRNILKKIPAVLFGELSLVGPSNIKNTRNIYLGKKGITGLWFIDETGTGNDEFHKLDIYYAKNQNIWLDLEIIGKTIAKILFGVR